MVSTCEFAGSEHTIVISVTKNLNAFECKVCRPNDDPHVVDHVTFLAHMSLMAKKVARNAVTGRGFIERLYTRKR